MTKELEDTNLPKGDDKPKERPAKKQKRENIANDPPVGKELPALIPMMTCDEMPEDLEKSELDKQVQKKKP
jgi:Zn-dependent M16 (insulinase) family peptidase